MSVARAQAIINGVTVNLTKNTSSGKWEATATAPQNSSYNQSGHYYGVTIKAWDEAGNLTTKDVTDATLGAALKLVVKERTAPVITITYPTAGATIINNKPVITWKVTDNDSGVDPATIGVTIDSGSKVTGNSIVKTAISGGYQCSYTPGTALSDGGHTIKMDASDYDGNAATQKSVTFKVDTVPPTLSISGPTDGFITNNASCTVSGTTNDSTSSPCKVTVKLNSGSAEAVTVGADGSFLKAITLAQGSNTIIITSTDSAGKSTTVTRNVILDTTAPVVNSVVLTPNPVNTSATFTISVEISD